MTMRLTMLWTCKTLGAACWFIAFVLAAPFALAGDWLEGRSEDLEGQWRRGRKQNRLWRWARIHMK